MLRFLTVSIQNAVASRDEDSQHILNSLVSRKGTNLDLEPLQIHDNHDKLNYALRGAVFSSQATLNLVCKTRNKRYWNSVLSAFAKSNGKKCEISWDHSSSLNKITVDDIKAVRPEGSSSP